MRLVIFIDSRYRDTLGCLLVKKQLQKIRKDWDILAVSIDLWQQVMELYKPHVVVLNHAIGYRNKEIIRRADYSIVLPTEGRPNTKEQEDWFVEEQDGVANLYLSWNSLADKFKKTQAVVTGCPRFDVYHTHTHLIDSQQKARAKYGLDQNRKTIGVFTSFPQAKFSFQQVEFNKRDWQDLGVDKISTRTNPLEFAQSELAKRREFMNAIAALADVYTDYQFLIKPHPMEDVLELQEWSDKNGFKLVTQDTIFNVISACDLVINRTGCITTLDTWLMDKPVVSFGQPEADGIAYQGNFIYDVYELIESLETEREVNINYIELCGLDHPATERVAKAIVSNVDKLNTVDKLPIKNMLDLQTIITQHGWQGSILDIGRGAVGKSATSSYINSWEERL